MQIGIRRPEQTVGPHRLGSDRTKQTVPLIESDNQTVVKVKVAKDQVLPF